MLLNSLDAQMLYQSACVPTPTAVSWEAGDGSGGWASAAHMGDLSSQHLHAMVGTALSLMHTLARIANDDVLALKSEEDLGNW